MSSTTIYPARTIVTMNRSLPRAEAVAVRGDRIVCVGTVEQCRMWDADATVDETFRDLVLVPGMVEAHGHTAQGAYSRVAHVGYHDMPQPDGGTAPGVRSYDELVARLTELDRDLPPEEVLLAKGFDPIYFEGQPRLDRTMLDRVSARRYIVIRHASGHLATLNSGALAAEGITADSLTPGVQKGPDGQPTGELQETPAMQLATRFFERLKELGSSLQGVTDYGLLCHRAGVTTSTELVGMMLVAPESGPAWQQVVNAEGFPARLVMYNVPTIPGSPFDPVAVVEQTVELRAGDSDRFRVGGIKTVLDGSIQGWTAKMLPPGYMTGTDQGLLTEDPDRLHQLLVECNRRGVNLHAHCNGSAAGQVLIEACDQALREVAWLDNRHNLTHSQTTTRAQYRRLGRLGMGASIFMNHLWYWGDQHYEQTLGPEGTAKAWACRTALDEGVTISLHTDAGVTPVGMLTPMWAAVNRTTPEGRVLGAEERITPAEALEAVTLGAAWQLHLDSEIGSIEGGKKADFTVLADDPLAIDPMAIKDIPVWGTVLSGRLQPVGGMTRPYEVTRSW